MVSVKQNRRFTSLENALRLLNCFSMDEPERGISELAERLGIANSTVHRLVTTLVSEGFLTKDRHTNLYRLGASVLSLGNIVTSRLNIINLARPLLEALVQQSKETAHIGVLKDYELVYLCKIDCSHPVRLLSHEGKRNPIHCTSSGQVLLAYQPPKVIEQFLQRDLEPYTSKTITNPDTFRSLLRQIQKQGFALSIEELHEGVASIAAPVRDPKGKVIASVTIAGPIQRINRHTIPDLIKLVVQTGNEISKRLETHKQN
jgi:DNA-binding IclR family transcriptional regulator